MKTRHSYTARKKLEVIAFAEQVGNRAASRKYQGVSEACIRGWRKVKDRLLGLNGSVRAERGRIAAIPVVENALLQWLKEVEQNNEPVNFVDLMVKARLIVRDVSDTPKFKASKNWLYRFVKRHSLSVFSKKKIDKSPNNNNSEDERNSPESQLKCKFCDLLFDCVDHLVEHVDIHKTFDKIEQSVCEFCGKSFATKGSLKTHLVVHTEEKPHECNLCGKSFRFISSLMTHIGTHTKPYECDVCGKHFSDPYLCKRHAKVHLKDRLSSKSQGKKDSAHRSRSYGVQEKLYCCDVCAKSFTTINMLIRHMGAHSAKENCHDSTSRKWPEATNDVEIKEEVCEEEELPIAKKSVEPEEVIDQFVNVRTSGDCSDLPLRRTSADFGLKYNRVNNNFINEIDSERKIFKCELCGTVFKSLKNLKSHVLATHMGKDDFKCHLCEKIFSSFEEFQTHMKSYVTDRIFSCTLCKKYFGSNLQLQTHTCSATRRQKKAGNECQRCQKTFKFESALKSHKCKSSLSHEKFDRPMGMEKAVEPYEDLKDINLSEQSNCATEHSPDVLQNMELEELVLESQNASGIFLEAIGITEEAAEGIVLNDLSKIPDFVTREQENLPRSDISIGNEILLKDCDSDRSNDLARNSALISESSEHGVIPLTCLRSSELMFGVTDPERSAEERSVEAESLTKCHRDTLNSLEVLQNTNVSCEEIATRQEERLSFWDSLKTQFGIDDIKFSCSSDSLKDLSVCDIKFGEEEMDFNSLNARETHFECEKCGKSYNLRIAFKKHRCDPVHDDSCRRSTRIKRPDGNDLGTLSCNCCTLSESCRDTSLKSKPIYVCSICKKTFGSPVWLRKHISTLHSHSKGTGPVCVNTENMFTMKNCSQRFAEFNSNVPSEKHLSKRQSVGYSNSSAFTVDSSFIYEKNSLHKDKHRSTNFLFNYSYDERPYGCGLCPEVFRTKDETLSHFFKCISSNI